MTSGVCRQIMKTWLCFFSCGCCRNKRGQRKREQGKVNEEMFPLKDLGPKQPLTPIKETASDSQPPLRRHSRHRLSQRSLKRQQEDQIPLAESGPTDQPPSPTDSNAVDLPSQHHESATTGNAVSRPSQDHEPTHREPSHMTRAPIQRTPERRRKKMVQQPHKPPASANSNTSDLPPHYSSRATQPPPPSQTIAKAPIKKSPDVRKNRKIKPSTDHFTSGQGRQHSRPPSQITPEVGSAEKKEDSPYDSEHVLPPLRRTPDIRKNSPRMLRKAKVLPSSTTPALATSSHTPEPSPKVPRELGPKVPVTEFLKKTHLDISIFIIADTA